MKRITDFDAGDVFKIKQSDQKIPNFKQIPLRKYFEKKMEDKFLVVELIKRDLYLNRLIERRENGLIKVVTGIRRCGKSYLLFKL